MDELRGIAGATVPNQLYIAGSWVDPVEGRKVDSVDPFTGSVWTEMPWATGADLDKALSAARVAQDSTWGQTAGRDRRKALLRIADSLAKHANELSVIESVDNGKLLREMAGQLDALPDWYEYYAGAADKIRGSYVPVAKPGFTAFTIREPVGVCGAITAWNSPLLLMAWKLAPALAAGCTMVIKPSEHASASTLAFGRVLQEADLPAGTVSILVGGPDLGRALTTDPRVDKISFTGSVPVGAAVASAAGAALKRVTLELGGKSPNIIFEDAPMEAALAGAVSGIFAATGQTCAAGSRLLVQASVYGEVVRALAERAASIRLGDPLLQETEMGPVAFAEHRTRIESYIEGAVQQGASVLCGGRRPTDPDLMNGMFVEPTILVDVDNGMTVAQEEIFGPVLAVIPFMDEDDAVRIAHETNFGLAAGVWTNDVGRAHRMVKRLRVGTVWVNSYRVVSYEMPYGGFGHSGVGRENGLEALDAYLEDKAVWISASSAIRDPFKLG